MPFSFSFNSISMIKMYIFMHAISRVFSFKNPQPHNFFFLGVEIS